MPEGACAAWLWPAAGLLVGTQLGLLVRRRRPLPILATLSVRLIVLHVVWRNTLNGVDLTEEQRGYLEQNHGAAMITLRPDGTPSTVRVGVALVDGHVWSSGTQNRRRTAYLRRDPRSTVFVFDAGFRFLTIDSRVAILDGPDAPELSVRFFRIIQNRPTGPIQWYGADKPEEEFRAQMVSEQRLIYQFEPVRIYGLLG